MIIRFLVALIYHSLKSLAILYQRIYFPDTKVINSDGLKFSGPAIIVSNHPNTMLDPIHVISRTPRRSSFLANASMFKNPLASAFLNHFAIPILRPGRDKGVKKVDNRQSFIRSYEHLAKNGVIFIAPEGTSEMERHLRPLKTGTARISLAAEAENDFKLGVRIIPVGLSYEHPHQCGSRLLIKVGEPLFTKTWESDYLATPKEAVNKMTAELEDKMQSLIIHTEDKEQDQLLYRLESIWQNDEPQDVLEHYNRIQSILSGLIALRKEDHNEYNRLLKDAENYRYQLKAHNLTDRGISSKTKSLLTPTSLLAWPFWLYGRINNFIAIEIPRWLVGKLDLYKGYNSTVKILSGVITFPLSYFLQYKLVQYFFTQPIAWTYLISLPFSAFIYRYYQNYMDRRIDAWRWRRWASKEPLKAEVLLTARKDLKSKADIN